MHVNVIGRISNEGFSHEIVARIVWDILFDVNKLEKVGVGERVQ